jgi:hypothetical protein
MTMFRFALATLLLASVQANTPDNVSSRLSINVSALNDSSNTVADDMDRDDDAVKSAQVVRFDDEFARIPVRPVHVSTHGS